MIPAAHLADWGLATLCARVCHAQKALPSEGSFHGGRHRTGKWDEGHRLGHDDFTGQMKGKGKSSLSLVLRLLDV